MAVETRDPGSRAETDGSAADVLVAAGVDRAREMYRRFLESDYPDALAMAEEVLRIQPDDVMALAIRTECHAALRTLETVPAPDGTAPVRLDSEMPTGITPSPVGVGLDEATPVYVTVTRGEPSREMCRRFLDSDHPAALLLAEAVLEANPNDRMARAIAEQCRAALETLSMRPSASPPSDDDTQVCPPPVGSSKGR